MNWKTLLAIVLLVSSSAWMLFDGTRALIVGEYVTAKTGEYAGQLGPWSNLVRAAGLEPRSTLMKSIFVVNGLGILTLTAGYMLHRPWANNALLVAALLGLWYLPIGTLTNLISLILLLLTRRKAGSPRPRDEMPDFIQDALHKRGLMDAYLTRPPDQRNDYIGWITRPRLTATRQKRLKQMLDELKKGNVYMKMNWTPK